MDASKEKSINESKRQRNKGRDRDMNEAKNEVHISLIMLNTLEFNDRDCDSSEFN
jgi:hypothetical protein